MQNSQNKNKFIMTLIIHLAYQDEVNLYQKNTIKNKLK